MTALLTRVGEAGRPFYESHAHYWTTERLATWPPGRTAATQTSLRHYARALTLVVGPELATDYLTVLAERAMQLSRQLPPRPRASTRRRWPRRWQRATALCCGQPCARTPRCGRASALRFRRGPLRTRRSCTWLRSKRR